MKATRQAVMRVSRQLLEELMPDWKTAAVLRYGELIEERLAPDRVAEIAEPYHKALKLPTNCRITGISIGFGFDHDEIGFRIESLDFVETLEGNMLPEVQAVYRTRVQMACNGNDGLEPLPLGFDEGTLRLDGTTSYFAGWAGPAVLPASSRAFTFEGSDTLLAAGAACWRCGSFTGRYLPARYEGSKDQVAECQECAEKSLL